MKLLLHDLEPNQFRTLFPEGLPDTLVVGPGESLRVCIGCFGCWGKTPGKGVIRDAYGDMGKQIASCSEFILLSRCFYGGFSPFVKSVLDRSISYLLPDFRIVNGEMHHKPRYAEQISLHACFYGPCTDEERATAERLVKGNVKNFNAAEYSVRFLKHAEEWREQL